MFRAALSPPRLFTLILVTGLSTLSLNLFLPSLTNIADAYQADYGLASFSISGYLAMTAVLQLFIGPLSDRLGRRPVLLVALAVFIFASIGCVLATNIWAFLTFRMLQASIIAGAALSPAVIRDMVPAQKTASLLGYVSMAMAIAPMLGPMFGGMLDDLFGWRANFITFIVIGALTFVLCWSDLGETNKTPSETVTRQFRAYPQLLKSRRFWGYCLCMAFSTGSFYAFLAGVPLVNRTLFSMSPGVLGFYMGTITVGFFLGSFLSSRYASRYALATPIICGRIVACAGLVGGLLLFTAGYIHVISLFGATAFVGLGNGLTMPGASAGAMSVKPELAGSASGLTGALTVAGGAMLTWVTGTILSEENGAYLLLGMMLFSASAGLIAAIFVVWVDRSEESDDGFHRAGSQ